MDICFKRMIYSNHYRLKCLEEAVTESGFLTLDELNRLRKKL